MRRSALVLAAAVLLAGCGGSPAIKPSAPTATSTEASSGASPTADAGTPTVATDPSASTTPLVTKDTSVQQPGPAPDGTVPLQRDGFMIAVPQGWEHEADTDIDAYNNEKTGESLTIVTRPEKSLEAAIASFNAEEPDSALPMDGIVWEGAKRAAIGQGTVSPNPDLDLHVVILFVQLPSGKIISVSAVGPEDGFEESDVLDYLNTFTVG